MSPAELRAELAAALESAGFHGGINMVFVTLIGLRKGLELAKAGEWYDAKAGRVIIADSLDDLDAIAAKAQEGGE